MTAMSRENAHEKLQKLLTEWGHAQREYQRIAEQYIYSGPVAPGKPIPMPPRVLDTKGLKELEAAFNKLQEAEKKFHQALEEFGTWPK
jgi:hypothetical protein